MRCVRQRHRRRGVVLGAIPGGSVTWKSFYVSVRRRAWGFGTSGRFLDPSKRFPLTKPSFAANG
jgi:hypothetical protein